MRNLGILLFCIIFLASCQDKPVNNNPTIKTTFDNNELTLEGTWELVSYFNYQGNIAVDTFKTDDDIKQIKMYTKKHFMWSKKVPLEDDEWHGFGTYVQTDSTLSETVKYGSATMQNLIANSDQFYYHLELQKDSYSQIVTDDEGYRIYSENYRRIE